MNSKKIAALLLSAAMLLPITACSNGETPSDAAANQPDNTVQTTSAETDIFRISTAADF